MTDPPVPRPEGSPTQASPEEQAELVERPRGLLGLLLWPLTAAITLGLRLFSGFVAGVLGALLPGRKAPPPEDGPGEQRPGPGNTPS